MPISERPAGERPAGSPRKQERPAGVLPAWASRGVVAAFALVLALSAIGVAISRGPPASSAATPAPPARADTSIETAPVQITASTFEYPEELWDAQVEGTTTLRLFISPVGSVDTVRLERSSGHAAFDSVAVAGAPALRFEPATRGGRPIAAWYLLPVAFELAPPAP